MSQPASPIVWGLWLHRELVFGYALWTIGIAVALAFGKRPERILAVALLIDFLSVALYHNWFWLQSVLWRDLIGDVAVLLVLLYLSRTFRRRWLIPALGVQIANVAAHVPRMIDPTVKIWGYASVTNLLGYGLIVTLLIGTLTEGRSDGRRG